MVDDLLIFLISFEVTLATTLFPPVKPLHKSLQNLNKIDHRSIQLDEIQQASSNFQ